MYVGTERRQLAACRRVMQRSIDGLVEGLTQYRFDQTPFFNGRLYPARQSQFPAGGKG